MSNKQINILDRMEALENELKLTREALEIAIDYQREACQTFHDSFRGFYPDEHLKFVEQALEKIGE